LIQATLPTWFVRASPQQRQQLTESMAASHASRAYLASVLDGMQGITEFARPLLAKALDEAFGPGLDPQEARFFHARFEREALTGRRMPSASTTQPLLQAALHNYEAKEARAAGEESTSVIYYGKADQEAPKASPRRFIELCRQLDLGGRYQTYLDSLLSPPVKTLIIDHQTNALMVATHIARMTHMISEPVWRMLLSIGTPGLTQQLQGKAVGFLRIKMLGVDLRGVLVFQARSENRCVVYMPGQTVTPLKEYSHFGAFMQELRERSRNADYHKYLEQLVPLRSRAMFFSRLEDALNPYVTRSESGSVGRGKIKIRTREPNPNAHLRLEKKDIGGSLSDYFYLQQMLRIKDDARVLAVPTGDEDERSRKARLAGFLERGLDVLNLAGLFLSGLGEAMLLVAGSQLLIETFEGVEAWTHGQMGDALGHLSSIAESIAATVILAKVGVLTSGQVPSIKPSSLIQGMEAVPSINGKKSLRLAPKPPGIRTIKPDFKAPTRLADGRIGYLLSGRGDGASAWTTAPRHTLDDAMRALYPETLDIQSHIRGLLMSGENMTGLVTSTQSRLQEYEVLRSTLDAWATPEVAEHRVPISGQDQQARRNVADALCRAWRYSHDDAPVGSDILLLESVNLGHVHGLPELPSFYSQIRYLTLRNLTANAGQLDDWLRRFSQLSRLEIVGSGGLPALPSGLSGLEQLYSLSIQGQGLLIDQQAMNLLMDIPRLGSLNLSGNRLGTFTDTSRLRLNELRLNDMGLTQWPGWVDAMNLRELDISDNQISALPAAVTGNHPDPFHQTVIFAYRNPINLQDLQTYWLGAGRGRAYVLEFDFPPQIRALCRPGNGVEQGSSSGLFERQSHSSVHSGSNFPAPSPDLWVIEGRSELNARFRSAWQRVHSEADAAHLLMLLQRLRETADFQQVRESLAWDVMQVLEVAAEDSPLRSRLDVMANDRLFGVDQTCQDGVRLIFSDIQVAAYAHSALQGATAEQKTGRLLGVIRNMFRLNEIQAIADEDIARQESLGVRVDHAEVRMAYRTGLASHLSLPGQPLRMVWEQLSNVGSQAIANARRLILEREAGPAFLEFAVRDRLWNAHLRAGHATDLEQATASIRAQMDFLEEHPPADHEEYDQQGRLLIARRDAAEDALLKQLTNTLRQAWDLSGR